MGDEAKKSRASGRGADGYLRTIERRFVALRGRGVLLSPKDVALVEGWRDRGVPLRLVLGVLERGVMRFAETHPSGTPLPSALGYFAGHVEAAIVMWRERLLGWGEGTEEGEASTTDDADPGDLARLFDRLAAAGRNQDREDVREVLRRAWRSLRRRDTEEGVWARVAQVDEVMMRELVETLDPAMRATLDAQAECQLPDGPMSEQAREDLRRVARDRALRERFGVPDLVEAFGDDNL